MTSGGRLTTGRPLAVDLDPAQAEVATPAPTVSAEQVAVDRSRTLVRDMSTAARQRATDARDRVDALLSALAAKERELLDGIEEFATQIQQTAAMVDVIMTPIEELAAQIEGTVGKPPVRTITHRA